MGAYTRRKTLGYPGQEYEDYVGTWKVLTDGTGPLLEMSPGGTLARESIREGTVLLDPRDGQQWRVDYNQDNGGILNRASSPARSTPYPTVAAPADQLMATVHALFNQLTATPTPWTPNQIAAHQLLSLAMANPNVAQVQAYLTSAQAYLSGNATVSTVPPSTGTQKPPVQAGSVFHYEGTAITIKSVGSGGSNGLLTDEGVQLPIGTHYTFSDASGAQEEWKATGPNTAEQVVAPPSAGSNAGGGGSPTSWFSEAAFLGIPNWMLLAGGAGFFFFRPKR